MSEERTVRSVVNQWAKDHIVGDATPMAFLTEDNREDLIVRLDQLRADLEAARESNAILDTALQHCCEANQDFERRLQQSHATEAELRAALGQVWSTLINQMCVAGSEAWKIADDVLDVETKKQLLRAELDDDELAALDAQ